MAWQSERLAELYEANERSLVRYVYSQLTRRGYQNTAAWQHAEDITQGLWVRVAREGDTQPLLSGEPLTDDAARAILFNKAKQEITSYAYRRSIGDIAVDTDDPVTCNRLCPLLPSGCALVELPTYLAKMVDALPEQERAALLLMLDGLDPRTMAEHLACADSTAERLASAAVVMLQIDNPELSREPVALETLPRWEREALAGLSPARREALLRLESSARQVVLLKHQGLSVREIVQRLGMAWDEVAAAARCVAPTPRATKKGAKGSRRLANSKFNQVANALRQDIKAMRPGDRLPRRTDLMARFEVGSRTIDNAWAVLRREGLIQANGVYGYTVTRTQGDMGRAA
ncbi:GntR family transcriptional regulator [Streptomyces sp. NPDC102340]|uniref:GntR family transcriptional regulator n=1 Tax=unclassified Streptomyces TaxID=2593676 RepID=UPI00381AD891